MTDSTLSNCGCCQGPPGLTDVTNRPGLDSLSYRIGVHGVFLRMMMDRIHMETLTDDKGDTTRPLATLTTRSLDDPALALMDAWAAACDILTFYQERIANEGFLRTATERRSVLELSREVGYELSPGVAASTWLAFTLEIAANGPPEITVASGTKVQSVPAQGKQPQTFETVEEIQARPEWNAMRLRTTAPQPVSTSMDTIFFSGTSTQLKVGDRLLILQVDAGTPKPAIVIVRDVQPDSQKQWTLVLVGTQASGHLPKSVFMRESVAVMGGGASFESVTDLSGASIGGSELTSIIASRGWSEKLVVASLNSAPTPARPQDEGVYAFRAQTACFGHNAPWHDSLLNNAGNPLYANNNWDNPKSPWDIWHDPNASDNKTVWKDGNVFLERIFPGILSDSFVAFVPLLGAQAIYRVEANLDASLAAFGMSGTAAALNLTNLSDGQPIDTSSLPALPLRKTAVYAQSEPLELAEIPIPGPLPAGTTNLTILGTYLYLQSGQLVALTGQMDNPRVDNSEILVIDSVSYQGGDTLLVLTKGLENSYVRETVVLNANVARATHGETVREPRAGAVVGEVLGSGDASQTRQSFALKRPPLTYVSAATATGAQSTLKVYVNGVTWEEASSLYGLGATDQKYIVRLADDGTTTLTFGDPAVRLPTGVENVIASYRSGIGPDANVDAATLTLLQSKPLGVRSVLNPLPGSGGAAPEHLDRARDNAPIRTKTLDRIVSREDYEDFARAFAGIGKAQAVALWTGEQRIVHLTIGGANGEQIDSSSKLYESLVGALSLSRDPVQRVDVDTFDLLQFDLAVALLIDSRFVSATVQSQVTNSLTDAFSYPRRDVARPVSAAEIIRVVQSVPGVIASNLTQLSLSTLEAQALPPEPPAYLPCLPAHWDKDHIVRAQLLLLNPAGLKLMEMHP